MTPISFDSEEVREVCRRNDVAQQRLYRRRRRRKNAQGTRHDGHRFKTGSSDDSEEHRQLDSRSSDSILGGCEQGRPWRSVLRTVISFLLFYVLVPSVSAYYAVKHHVERHGDGEEFIQMLVTIPFYLYAAGSVHFSYTNKILLRYSILQDAARRMLTWDLPCQAWITFSLILERLIFRNYDSSGVLAFITMSFLLPVVIIVVSGLTFLMIRKTTHESLAQQAPNPL